MNTDTTTIHKTNGRKTTNDALTTLLRAGVIASIMMLVLGAGMAAAFDDSGGGGESTDIQSAPLGTVHASSDLGDQAASLAEGVVGALYLWGGKGWNWNPDTGSWSGGGFLDSATIKNGYYYYNPSTGTVTYGKGLDCSGLSFWAFNKAAGSTKYVDSSNPIYYEGASGQWNDGGRFEQISTTVPTVSDLNTGDLLFLDTPDAGSPDHVGMYVGNGYVIHSRGSAGVEKKTLNDWLNIPYGSKKYKDYFFGYGRVKAASGGKFDIGDTVRVTTNLNVRTGPGTGYLEITDPDYPGFAPEGTTGNVLDGPSSADGYIWWKIDYGPGLYSGWSVEGGLEKVEDAVLPTVDVFSVSPASVTLGNSFTISYTVSDTGGSGLNRVELWRKSETVDWQEIDRTSLAGVGNGPYSGSFSDVPPSVGTYWYGVHAVDNAENRGWEPDPPGPIEVEVTQPDTTPPSASISIDSGATYTDSTSVTLILTYSDSGSGIDKCRYKNSGGSWTGWQSCSSSKSWTLSSGDGTKTVYYEVKDKAGNVKQVYDSITLDTTDPSALISIDSGATYTDSTSVTLILTHSDSGSGIDKCRYKNSGGSWTGWQSCSSSKSWTLSSGDGTKTVYYEVKDKAGNVKQVYDSITLDTSDTTDPTISITYPTSGDIFTTATLTVSGSASDNVGLSKVEVKVGSGSWQLASGTTSWSKSVTLASGSNTIYAKATDTSGNTKETSVTVTYDPPDTTDPTISITYPTSGDIFTTATLTVSGSASDDVGLSKVEVKVGSGGWQLASGKTSWSKSVTLASGSNTIHARATDTSGNTKETSVTVTYTPDNPLLCTTPDPPSHDFGNLLEGQTSSWTFDVTNSGTGTLDWTTSDDQSWIGVAPAGGSTTTETDEVTVTIDTTGLSVGTYTGHVTIDAGAGGIEVGTITVTVDDDPDTTPPSAVTDLTATNPTTTTMTLGWTAPGDDGSTGTAASYDVRYRAGAAITESNWNSANQCTGEPTPGPAGSTETFVVTGLSPSTTYYFALKTADEVPNWSPISNMPQEATSGEVIAIISIADAAASPSDTTTTQITINNMTNFGAATVTLSYDPSVVQINSVTAGEVGTPTADIDNTAGTATTVAYISTVTGPDSPITFANVELLAVGNSGESSSLTLEVTALADADGTSVPATAESSIFTISRLRGDANDDGVVNVVDAMFVAQYVVGNRDASDLNMANADANLGGTVDVVDAMFIAQYVVGSRTW